MQDHENDPLTTDEYNNAEMNSEPVEEPFPINSEADSVSETSDPDIPVGEEGDLPKEENRARRIFRKFIRWTVGLLIIFCLGFLTAVFTIYNQKADELNQSQNELGGAGTTISELEAQITDQQNEIESLNTNIKSLNMKVEALEGENLDLIGKQDNFHLHIALLKARADVVSAQVELYEENPAHARVLLESASLALIKIESLLPEDLKDVVAPLQSRLELAVGGIDDDPETAIADLGILASDLLEIEDALFKE